MDNSNIIGNYVFLLEKASTNLTLKNPSEYILEGTAAIFGIENSNHRIYEEEEYLPHLSYLMEKISKKRLVGELDHPKDFDVSLKNISHLIESLVYDKASRSLKIKVRLLDTPAGEIAKRLIDAGIPISISSRAAGQVSENKRVSIKKIFTYDLVMDPGFPTAQLGRVYESLGSNFSENEYNSSIIDNLILLNQDLNISETDNLKIYNVNDNENFKKLMEMESKNKQTEDMKKVVLVDELNDYSLVIKKEFDSVKESIQKIQDLKVDENSNNTSALELRIEKLEKYSTYLAENLENAMKYGDYLSKNLDESISYTKYLAENLDKSISYGKYLSENLDKSISYAEYIKESVNNNITRTEELSEKVDQTISYAEYLVENVEKGIGYTEYIGEKLDRTIGYTEYLGENLDKNISYASYLGENLSKNISYSTYLAEKLKNSISYGEYIAESVNKMSNTEMVEKITEETKTINVVNENSDYSNLSKQMDSLLESVQKQKTDIISEEKTEKQEVEKTPLNENETETEVVEKTGIKFIDEMPEKFRNSWTSLNEGFKASIIAQATSWKLETPYQINNFWATRNLGSSIIGLQKLNESEGIEQTKEKKQAYSNAYVESIAKALEGKFQK